MFSRLIVDDHPLLRLGLRELIGHLDGITVCGEAENAQAAVKALGRFRPELAIVDVCLPGTNGIDLVKLMLAKHPELKVLMISVHDDPLYAIRAYRAGARAYVPKDEALETILDAIRTVIGGTIYVSPKFRDRPIFKLIQAGHVERESPVNRLSKREVEVLELIG